VPRCTLQRPTTSNSSHRICIIFPFLSPNALRFYAWLQPCPSSREQKRKTQLCHCMIACLIYTPDECIQPVRFAGLLWLKVLFAGLLWEKNTTGWLLIPLNSSNKRVACVVVACSASSLDQNSDRPKKAQVQNSRAACLICLLLTCANI
jgi:hypothetical protein